MTTPGGRAERFPADIQTEVLESGLSRQAFAAREGITRELLDYWLELADLRRSTSTVGGYDS